MALTFSLLVSSPVISSASESGDTAIEVANSLAAGVSLSSTQRTWIENNPTAAQYMVDASISDIGEETSGEEDPTPEDLEALGEPTNGFVANPPAGLEYADVAAAKVRCKTTVRYRNWKSTKIVGIGGGKTMYRYNTYVCWCYNNSKITKVVKYYAYFSNVNYLYDTGNAESVRKNNASGKNRQIHTQGNVKFIGVKGIPSFSYRPWNKVTVTPKGSSSLRSGE